MTRKKYDTEIDQKLELIPTWNYANFTLWISACIVFKGIILLNELPECVSLL